MSRIITILKYMCLRNMRDTGGTLLQMIVFPIGLIFILGMSLSSAFEHQEIGPTAIGYLDEDKGLISPHFDQFLKNPEIKELLTVHIIDSKEQGIKLLKHGELSAIVHIKPGFSEEVMKGGQTFIEVTGHPERSLRVKIVENLVESFVSGANTIQVMQAMGSFEAEYVFSAGFIEDHPVSASGLTPGAMDYYGVTMLVMIIMYGALYSTSGMNESYLTSVGKRIKTTPIHRRELYIGLIASNVVTVFIQGLIVILFTRHVFGVNWGDNMPMVLLIIFVLVVLAIGLGIMVTMVVRDEMRATNLINIFVVFSTFIAGGYISINLPGVLANLRYLSPNYYAQTALFNTIYDGSFQQAVLMLAAMLALITGTFVIAMTAERRFVQ